MMDSMPSTPADGTFQRQRQRFGGDYPYRDDPRAPPSARLETFTVGGYGPLHSHFDDSGKGKGVPLCRQFLHGVRWVCQPCLQPVGGTDDNEMSYIDTFNDQSWSCSVGTTDEHGVWLNRSDPAGTIMALFVWILVGYSALTMTLLAGTGGIPATLCIAYNTLACLALACHVKTSLTDPGAVPSSAVPTTQQRRSATKLSMCSQCQTFKPPASHHCRICNRCISRMDHHCPWMNNCVGANNLKHFLLFLAYTWTCSVFSLLLFGWNYFFCANEACVFTTVLTQLVRIMTCLAIGAFLFTSSMLMNVVYGVMTGIGTIDRLKKKASGTMEYSDEEPLPLTHIFGIQPLWTWILPIDPLFPDYDAIMGYSTPQRLLREQMLLKTSGGMDGGGASSVMSRDSSWAMAV